MDRQAAVPLLSFIPGAFIGAACLFGTAFDTWATVLAIAVGAGLGWLSALIGDAIQRRIDGPAASTPQPA